MDKLEQAAKNYAIKINANIPEIKRLVIATFQIGALSDEAKAYWFHKFQQQHPVDNQPYKAPESQSQDDFEYNMHRHWKNDDDDDQQNIKHFQD